MLRGLTPAVDSDGQAEPGEVRKGWQREATKYRDNRSFNAFFSTLGTADKARVRSCAGPNSGRWLSAIPFEKALKFECPIFRMAVLRRLGLPVETLADTCEGCGNNLDEMGYHRTTCMRSGRVQTRHKPLIQIWRRIFREAGINISNRNTERTLGSTHIRRSPNDLRRMDFLCPGVDGVFGGAPLFVDVTMVSPLHGNGTPMPHSATEDGTAVRRAAETCRLRDYPDVEASPHAQLLSLGVETYGRWSSQCQVLIRNLARSKSANAPAYLQKAVQHAFFARAWTLLSVCVQQIVCESIVRDSGADLLDAAESLSRLTFEDLLDFHR